MKRILFIIGMLMTIVVVTAEKHNIAPKLTRYVNPKDTAICRDIANQKRFAISSTDVSDTIVIGVAAYYNKNKRFTGYRLLMNQKSKNGGINAVFDYRQDLEKPKFESDKINYLYDLAYSQTEYILYWINLLFEKSQQDKDYIHLLRYDANALIYMLFYVYVILPYTDESSNPDNAPK